MADPVETVVSAAKAPLGWAKARPFVFFLFLLFVIVMAIRFSDRIVGLLSRSRLTAWMVPPMARAAAAAALFLLATPAALGAIFGG